MANRGNVPNASKVHSGSDEIEEDDFSVDTTDYPFSSYHPFHYNCISPDDNTGDHNYYIQSGLNSTDRPCCVSNYKVTGKGNNGEENSENSEISSKSGNGAANSCEYVEHLGLSVKGGSVKTQKNNEDNAMVGTGEIASEGLDEEDETTEDNNYFEKFLKRSQVFIRNIIRRACDYPPPTPPE